MTRHLLLLSLLGTMAAAAGEPGGSAQCVGGSLAMVQAGLKGTVRTADKDAFVFVSPKTTLRIPYEKINLIEYGQEVRRRYVLAWAINPIFLLAKARAHFITLGFTDESGKQQALVLRIDKRLIRPELATLEARTGRVVQYQDDEARKFRHN